MARPTVRDPLLSCQYPMTSRVVNSLTRRGHHRSQLRQNVAAGSFTALWNIALSLISYPVYLHFFGYEFYGLWLLLSTVVGFAQLGGLGFGQALAKLVSEAIGDDVPGEIRAYFSTAVVTVSSSAAMVIIILLLCRAPIVAAMRLPPHLVPVLRHLFPVAAILSVYAFVVDTQNQMLAGLGRLDLCTFDQALGQTMGTAISIVAVALGAGIEAMLFGSAVALICVHGLSLWQVRRIWAATPTASGKLFSLNGLSRQAFKRLLLQGGGMLAGTLLAMLLVPFNRLMLSRYGNLRAVAVLDIAFSSSQRLRSVVDLGIRALMPEVSRLGGSGILRREVDLSALVKRATRFTAIVVLPTAVLLALLAEPILRLWLRGGFTPAVVPAFRICLLGATMSALGLPGYYVLLGLGRISQIIVAYALQSAVNVITLCCLVLVGLRLDSTLLSLTMAGGVILANVFLVKQAERAVGILRARAIRDDAFSVSVAL